MPTYALPGGYTPMIYSAPTEPAPTSPVPYSPPITEAPTGYVPPTGTAGGACCDECAAKAPAPAAPTPGLSPSVGSTTGTGVTIPATATATDQAPRDPREAFAFLANGGKWLLWLLLAFILYGLARGGKR